MDLVVATSLLVYYNSFDPRAAAITGVLWDRHGNGDTLFAYLRR
jgi:hypothetical protein